MSKLLKTYLILIATFCSWTAFAQQEDEGSSQNLMGYDAFMQLIVDHHPVVRQAQIVAEQGSAQVLEAKGAADPVISGSLNRKEFEEKQYYRLLQGGIKIPTWYAVSIKAGYENHDGIFLNSENNVPDNGLWMAGVSVPLGQGLFIDKRRAALRKARAYEDMNQFERILIINDLLYNAGVAYWDWFQTYNQVQIFEQAVTAAQQRFEAVKRGYRVGDKAAIDTVEARMQLLTRSIGAQKALVAYQNQRLELSTYLWMDGLVPLELDSATVPPVFGGIELLTPSDSLTTNMGDWIAVHPALNQQSSKVEYLKVEERYRKEMLKPVLNVDYNPLMTATNTFQPNPSMDGYKLGVQFSVPVFLRQERGALKTAKLDVESAEIKREVLEVKVTNQILKYLNEWQNSLILVEQYRQTVDAYSQLLIAERRMFANGESSLFMVNAREMGYIDSQIKWTEILAKNRTTALKTRYALGILTIEEFE